MNKEQTNTEIISKFFQPCYDLVIIGIAILITAELSDLLQGVNDDQPSVRVLIEEAGELFFQPLPDAAAFRLHDQPFGGFFAAHKLEKALLQAVEGVLQR